MYMTRPLFRNHRRGGKSIMINLFGKVNMNLKGGNIRSRG